MLIALLLAYALPALAQVPARSTSAPTPQRRMLELWHEKRATGARFDGATLAAIRGQTYTEFPELLKYRPPTSPERHRQQNRKGSLNPTFRGTHPMFKRLVRSGWYNQKGQIRQLQLQANALRQNRMINRDKPLSQVEFIAFDLEATNGSAGRFRKHLNRFNSGWDEPTQFGYTIYRGGKPVRSGTIDIRPDVKIDRQVSRITGLTQENLSGAKRFEEVAGQILSLMQGRVVLGQSAAHNDWGWLQSNFHRLGVNIPGPREMLLDTHLLSFNVMPRGGGLSSLTEHFKLDLRNAHNAGADARATGDVFFALMRHGKARTLGQAFALQSKGETRMHNPGPQPR